MEERLHHAAVQRLDAILGWGQGELASAELQEPRPPHLRWPIRDDEDGCRSLLVELVDDVAEQGPRRVEPDDLLLPIEG